MFRGLLKKNRKNQVDDAINSGTGDNLSTENAAAETADSEKRHLGRHDAEDVVAPYLTKLTEDFSRWVATQDIAGLHLTGRKLEELERREQWLSDELKRSSGDLNRTKSALRRIDSRIDDSISPAEAIETIIEPRIKNLEDREGQLQKDKGDLERERDNLGTALEDARRFERLTKSLIDYLVPVSQVHTDAGEAVRMAQKLEAEQPFFRFVRHILDGLLIAWKQNKPEVERRHPEVHRALRLGNLVSGWENLLKKLGETEDDETLWSEGLFVGFNESRWLHDLFRAELLLETYLRDREYDRERDMVRAAAAAFRLALRIVKVEMLPIPMHGESPSGWHSSSEIDAPLKTVPKIMEQLNVLKGKGKIIIDVINFPYRHNDQDTQPRVVMLNPAELD